MKRLLLADIHATLPAFEAVLAAAEDVDEIVCLGDVVGYGPHPAACVELLMSLGAKSVVGNHDLEVVITDVRDEYGSKFLMGQLDPAKDADWNAYMAALEKAGLKNAKAIRDLNTKADYVPY